VTQSREQRRLIRLAHAINKKAERVGATGRITAEQLAAIILIHPACHYCDIGLERGHGTFDHVVPFDRGGANLPGNIVRCCLSCNREKYTKSPAELARFREHEFRCGNCNKSFRPRYADWINGNGRFCSRACSASSRW
jgi:5-methylcytosine-specific restriction endonuclease McrA